MKRGTASPTSWSARAAWIGLALALGVAAAVFGLRSLDGSAPTTPERRAAAGSASEAETAATVPLAEIAALHERIEAEREAREALAEEVMQLRLEVVRLLGAAPGDAPAQPPATDPRVADPPGAARDVSAPDEAERPVFDGVGLMAAGLRPGEVAQLRERWDRLQMDKIELAHRAAQEGWLMGPRHRRELGALERELRRELGEEAYDQMLYATGQSNRVVVRDVVDRSVASRAGFERGDVILRFDDDRVFAPREILVATADVDGPRTARVEVERDGRRLTLQVPRGPLGLVLERERGAPVLP